jgi:membrane-associated protease RseP (regulator of RpoE activity)
VTSKKALLSVGTAGPISGFIVSTVVLIVGFITLPGKEYLYAIHPEYSYMQSIPESGLRFGSNLAYRLLEAIVPAERAFVPPMNEIYHYPFLCVGWFGLFVTSLNLIPVGQLDGGHIATAVLGNRAKKSLQISTLVFLLLLGLLGLLPMVEITYTLGWPGWLLWVAILFFLSRRDLSAPSASLAIEDRSPQSISIAVICLIIFLLTFIPVPITL